MRNLLSCLCTANEDYVKDRTFAQRSRIALPPLVTRSFHRCLERGMLGVGALEAQSKTEIVWYSKALPGSSRAGSRITDAA